jgi:hypothetical protein
MNDIDDGAMHAVLVALRWAARSAHHPFCPVPRGKGWTTMTRDDCTCHVKAARHALKKLKVRE